MWENLNATTESAVPAYIVLNSNTRSMLLSLQGMVWYGRV